MAAIEYSVKRGFGPGRVKEYFLAVVDSDTMSAIVAGPFSNVENALAARDGLRAFYGRELRWVGGHMVGWEWDAGRLDAPTGSTPNETSQIEN